MRTTASLLLVATLGLSGCSAVSQSKANPFNWFGGAEATTQTVEENTNPLIPVVRDSVFSDKNEDVYQGTAIARITELDIETVPGGAIIRATGIDAGYGLYEVRLTPTNDDGPVNGVLTYKFEARRAAGAGTEVTAAVRVSNKTLLDVRRVRVEAAQNALESRW